MRLPKLRFPRIRHISPSLSWSPNQPQSWVVRWLRNPYNATLIILLVIIVVSGIVWLTNRTGSSSKKVDIQLSSPSFANGDNLPTQFTCDGENISPEFTIKKVSKEVKTLAIIFEDLDIDKEQYKGSPYLAQQMVWNIPATVTTFVQGVRPPGTMGRTISGNYNYNGPCPPVGKTHNYRFTVYALSTDSLAVGADSGVEDLKKAISAVELSKSELNVSYTGVNKKD
ncbi:MAG: YbhB/YbcL family Raf kinase inhibitor-like protein [Patescibacteria group bacterium]